MIAKLLNTSLIISTLVAAMSVMYCALCIWAAARFASQRRRTLAPAKEAPPVSILKPVKGTDPEMYASLRSHCVQNYPKFEILFGVTNAEDPAIPVVEKLIQEFPSSPIRLVRCDKELGANGKVSSLAQLAAVAVHVHQVLPDGHGVKAHARALVRSPGARPAPGRGRRNHQTPYGARSGIELNEEPLDATGDPQPVRER